jgi:glucan-binding YG repeat protein
MLIFFIFCKKCKKSKKGIDNFHYRKYNYLVMQLGISKSISKRKKESALIMRKQTKLVAVLSTAALLALGASMSSFAATGWQEENGTWVYYDKNGDLETEKWEKSGDNWFYLNEDGEMATDAIVEYSDNYYYVDENGAMTANKWVSVENDDYDGDNEEEPANNWYYFGSNGKAYKKSTNSQSANFKTINGKKYVFDEEGKMLYGWINKEGERETTDEDKWQNGLYYCGNENDGAQTIGWVQVDIVDPNYADTDAGFSSGNVFDDENQTRWFYFKDNGKKMSKEAGKTINGKKYSFDEHGRMNAEWVNWDATPSEASASNADYDYIRGFRYYGSPEDGARITKGWFQVVPDSYLNSEDYEDDENNWYYSDKDGKLTVSAIKTINGKKYAFNEYGVMQDGLKAVKFDGTSTTDIEKVVGDGGVNGHSYKDGDQFKNNISDLITADGYRMYYFGSGDDGSMKTGKQTVTIDGEAYSFLFNKSGSTKGQGKFGVDSDKYYLGGMLLQADKDDKYAVVKATKSGNEYTKMELLTTEEFLTDVEAENAPKKGYTEFYDVAAKAADKDGVEYRLVNTAGTVQKSKSKAKDGSDRCFEVNKDKKITSVFVQD